MTGQSKIRRNIARTLARYRNLDAAGTLALYARALRLHLATASGPPPAAPRGERIVVSLSTIPSRCRSLAPVLRGLLDQSVPADRILLCLPHESRRGGQPYPDPDGLNLPERVEILRCDDLGPATKILPALRAEPDALVIAVDDDVIYPRRFIEILLAAHRETPRAALGFRGVRLEPDRPFADLAHVFASGIAHPQAVDVLFGTWGYLVPAVLTDAAFHEFAGYPEALRWVDDIWISGHLARLGIPRIVVRADTMPVETASSYRAALTDTLNRSGENDMAGIRAFAPNWEGAGATGQGTGMGWPRGRRSDPPPSGTGHEA